MNGITFFEVALIVGVLVFIIYIWRLPTRNRHRRRGHGVDSGSGGSWYGGGSDFGGSDCGGGGGD